jgi:RHS repeat-associated protein
MNHPVQVLDGGKLKVLDLLNNGRMEVVVEVKPEVEQVIDTSQFFNAPLVPPSGKRAIRYAFFDHLGSARMLTDNQGKVVWPSQGSGPNRLMPFGKDPYFDGLSSDTEKNSYLLTFTNKEIDYNLDLHYFGAQYYHSTFPRFISPDPVSGNPMNPISWNRYLYCRNDPGLLLIPRLS